MKTIFILISFFCITNAYAQVFYKSANNEEFQNLVSNGISFMYDKNDIVDNSIIQALKKYWTCSKYELIDRAKNITPNGIILGRITITVTVDDSLWGVENALGLFAGSYMEKEEVSKYKSIGYIELNGFNQNNIDSSSICLLEYAISGLNHCVEKIKSDYITGMGIKLYRGIADAINPQSSILGEKTLLIIDKTSEKVDFNDLGDSGLKYKKITLDEFKKIPESDHKKYAILYFAYNSYTETSIFNMEDKRLIFTFHYLNAHSRFDSKDLGKIMKYTKN